MWKEQNVSVECTYDWNDLCPNQYSPFLLKYEKIYMILCISVDPIAFNLIFVFSKSKYIWKYPQTGAELSLTSVPIWKLLVLSTDCFQPTLVSHKRLIYSSHRNLLTQNCHRYTVIYSLIIFSCATLKIVKGFSHHLQVVSTLSVSLPPALCVFMCVCMCIVVLLLI